jgi:hypothetical protein
MLGLPAPYRDPRQEPYTLPLYTFFSSLYYNIVT